LSSLLQWCTLYVTSRYVVQEPILRN